MIPDEFSVGDLAGSTARIAQPKTALSLSSEQETFKISMRE